MEGDYDAYAAFSLGSIDLYTHFALDRREGWSTPQACAVSLWFARSQGVGLLHPEVRFQTVWGLLVSLMPRLFLGLSSSCLTYTQLVADHRAGQLVIATTCVWI